MTRELFNTLPHVDVHVVLGRPARATALRNANGGCARACGGAWC